MCKCNSKCIVKDTYYLPIIRMGCNRMNYRKAEFSFSQVLAVTFIFGILQQKINLIFSVYSNLYNVADISLLTSLRHKLQ